MLPFMISSFLNPSLHSCCSIFDYASVVPAQPTDQHSSLSGTSLAATAAGPPEASPVVAELVSRSKLSCLSWNKFAAAQIASSDYEGGVGDGWVEWVGG